MCRPTRERRAQTSGARLALSRRVIARRGGARGTLFHVHNTRADVPRTFHGLLTAITTMLRRRHAPRAVRYLYGVRTGRPRRRASVVERSRVVPAVRAVPSCRVRTTTRRRGTPGSFSPARAREERGGALRATSVLIFFPRFVTNDFIHSGARHRRIVTGTTCHVPRRVVIDRVLRHYARPSHARVTAKTDGFQWTGRRTQCSIFDVIAARVARVRAVCSAFVPTHTCTPPRWS